MTSTCPNGNARTTADDTRTMDKSIRTPWRSIGVGASLLLATTTFLPWGRASFDWLIWTESQGVSGASNYGLVTTVVALVMACGWGNPNMLRWMPAAGLAAGGLTAWRIASLLQRADAEGGTYHIGVGPVIALIASAIVVVAALVLGNLERTGSSAAISGFAPPNPETAARAQSGTAGTPQAAAWAPPALRARSL